jgi:hypothetical protein
VPPPTVTLIELIGDAKERPKVGRGSCSSGVAHWKLTPVSVTAEANTGPLFIAMAYGTMLILS